MTNKFYISITPLLSQEELIFLNNFNELLMLAKKTCTPNNSIWLYKKKEFNDGFEVISDIANKDELKLRFDKNINKLSKYSESCEFVNNFMFLTNYKEFFLQSTAIHQHSNNYRIEHDDSPMFSHLFKLIHIFHEQGMIKKFLKLNLNDHEFSKVVINEQTEDGYIIENTNIYETSLLPSGYYTKNNEISLTWGSDLFEIMKKVTFENKLNNILISKDNDKNHISKL